MPGAFPASLYWSISFGRRLRIATGRPPRFSLQQNRTDCRSSVWACSLPVKSSVAHARQASTTRWTFTSSSTQYMMWLKASSASPCATVAKMPSALPGSFLRVNSCSTSPAVSRYVLIQFAVTVIGTFSFVMWGEMLELPLTATMSVLPSLVKLM